MRSIKTIDITDAYILIEGARARANEISVPMCIAITDEAGNLLAFERMIGGKVTSITIAIDKSFTASGAKKATHQYGETSQPGAPAYGINSAIGGRLMVVAGGLPIEFDGEVVGAIGVSSGTPMQDLDVAKAALNFFLSHK
jgi:uncharacterized protein GlcG (DUF336 family)